jgi:hypothetical protein
MLIACAQVITVNGTLRAAGGVGTESSSSGSGGAIRLVADTFQGSGSALALGGVAGFGGYGGKGRLRVECNTDSFTGSFDPNASIDHTPFNVAALWPDASAPTVRVTSIGGAQVPVDPHASFTYPLQDVTVPDDPVTALIEARHVPLNWNVLVRAVPNGGPDFSVSATYVSGNETLSTWQAALTFPNGFSAVQVRASAP